MLKIHLFIFKYREKIVTFAFSVTPVQKNEVMKIKTYMVKSIIFDFGGVIMTLDHGRAIGRFQQLGLKDAANILDPYTQGGIFGALEVGAASPEQFKSALSEMCGRDISYDECRWAWLGYAKDVPKRNITMLKRLRREGYRLIMLSNTNPYMMSWARSSDFSRGLDDDEPQGAGVEHYFDAIYPSYEVRVMKPDIRFFQHVLSSENINPEETLFVDDGPRNIEVAATTGMRTFLPINGVDWTEPLIHLLNNCKAEEHL